MDFANNSNTNIYNCYFQTIEQTDKIQMELNYISEPVNKANFDMQLLQIPITNPNTPLPLPLTQSNILALTYPNYNQTNNSDFMEDGESICSDMNTMADQELVMEQLGDLFDMLQPYASVNSSTKELMNDYIDCNDYTSCIGCIENQPNQQAHMGPFGCLVSI